MNDSNGKAQKVNRAAPNAPSVIYDGVVVLGGKSGSVLATSGSAIHFVNEAYRHGKPIAFFGEGSALLKATGFPEANAADGVIVADGDDSNVSSRRFCNIALRFALSTACLGEQESAGAKGAISSAVTQSCETNTLNWRDNQMVPTMLELAMAALKLHRDMRFERSSTQ